MMALSSGFGVLMISVVFKKKREQMNLRRKKIKMIKLQSIS